MPQKRNCDSDIYFHLPDGLKQTNTGSVVLPESGGVGYNASGFNLAEELVALTGNTFPGGKWKVKFIYKAHSKQPLVAKALYRTQNTNTNLKKN